MKKTVWMSYDLGVSGDYQSLYAWLDNNDAKECGDGFAVFSIDMEKGDDVFDVLRRKLEEHVSFGKRARIYALCRSRKSEVRGKFIVGHRRKQAPWDGYGTNHDQEEDSEQDEDA